MNSLILFLVIEDTTGFHTLLVSTGMCGSLQRHREYKHVEKMEGI